MRFRPLQTRLLLCALLSLTAPDAGAKLLRDVTGPKETPPANFTASQYVDSEGCIFVRAGMDGNVTWVPRVTRDRQVMCGQPPSLQPPRQARAAGRPAAQGAAVAAAPAPAPRAARVVAPVAPAMGLAPAAPEAAAAPPPAGYRPAWRDGRLNPLRGTGQTGAARPAAAGLPVATGTVAGGRFVQVGVFADPANAARAVARLQALGLPVARQALQANGRPAASVAAGPFAAGDAEGALGLVRARGFADAFLR